MAGEADTVTSWFEEAFRQGGGGGGSGPDNSGPMTSVGPTPLTRSSAWMRVTVGTASNAVSLKADPASVEDDQLDFIDVDRKWGTHAFTFDGNGHNVEDPMNADNPPAATWTSPNGWNDLSVSWQLLKNSSGTLLWKVV